MLNESELNSHDFISVFSRQIQFAIESTVVVVVADFCVCDLKTTHQWMNSLHMSHAARKMRQQKNAHTRTLTGKHK